VIRLAHAAGDRVAAGEELLVLEAMKMQHRVVAATSGTITELRVAVGRQVDAGAVLAVIEAVAETIAEAATAADVVEADTKETRRE
jgi:propionyl-CoA carboxylase alpha chain